MTKILIILGILIVIIIAVIIWIIVPAIRIITIAAGDDTWINEDQWK